MISKNGGCKEEVRHRVGAGWRVSRNVWNSMRQEDAHYAQSGSIARLVYIRPEQWKSDLGTEKG